MASYEHGLIGTPASELVRAGIDSAIIAQIMTGGEAIGKSAKPRVKAESVKEATQGMDALLDF